MKTLIKELGDKVKCRELSWEDAKDIYNKKTGEQIASEALRSRYRNLVSTEKPKQEGKRVERKLKDEFETTSKDGLKEIQREIAFGFDEDKTPETILKKLGYDPTVWSLEEWRFGTWEVAMKDEEENRLCTTVRAKLKPRVAEVSREIVLEAAASVLKSGVIPLSVSEPSYSNVLDKNKLLEMTAVELHFGKLAHKFDTGENYDHKIARARFEAIVEDVVTTQLHEKADTLFVPLGSDFFNTDTVTHTTTMGTPQDNDLRWKKLFLLGLEMWSQAIATYRERFNHIDIYYKAGNHDRMSSFYLFVALSQLFKDDPKVTFNHDFKPTLCYQWGKCAIFLNHGDKKGVNKRPGSNQLLRSIPQEFPREWGESVHRELHLDHLHTEYMYDDQYGIVLRRAPSASGTDEWHYENRYLATPKYQYYIWDKESGLLCIKNITFDKKKSLIKKKH